MSADEAGVKVRVVRLVWMVVGLVFTALGFAGLALPLLPGTPFFLLAAWAFTRSSPRLLAWLLGLPRVGPAIADYRAGLGVPRRTKGFAVALAGSTVSLNAVASDTLLAKVGVLVLGVVGIGYVLFVVPTRESVLGRTLTAQQKAPPI